MPEEKITDPAEMLGKEKLHTGFDPEAFEEIEEDEQIKVIEGMTDNEDIKAAQEIIFDELDETPITEGETSSKKEAGTETDLSKAKEKPETLAENQELTDEAKKKADEEAATKKSEEDKFVLTDEYIKKQSEEDQGILNKYVNKPKEELAKTVANAVAFKNPYLKDNAEAIKAIQDKLLLKTSEELVKDLIETQRETGSKTQEIKQEPVKSEIPDELPELPADNETLTKIISSETTKRLLAKYPTMPSDTTSQEYKDWLNDYEIDNGKEKLNQFFREKYSIEDRVKNEAKRLVYLENNYIKINNSRAEKEVADIKEELKKLGITEKEIGIDLSLTKDDKGSYYNKHLNDLLLKGDIADPDIIQFVGQIPLLKPGSLVSKFILYNNPKILNAITQKTIADHKQQIEKVKSENLNTLGSQSTAGIGSKTITVDQIEKMTNRDDIRKVQEDLLASL